MISITGTSLFNYDEEFCETGVFQEKYRQVMAYIWTSMFRLKKKLVCDIASDVGGCKQWALDPTEETA